MKDHVLRVRVDEFELQRLRGHARAADRPVAYLVRRALRGLIASEPREADVEQDAAQQDPQL